MVEDIWQRELGFWKGTAEYYEQYLATEACMIFPEPVGIMHREDVVDSIHSGSRWSKVTFTEQQQLEPTSDTRVLIYAATADRGGPHSAYSALCSSTYIRRNGEWQLIAHQQTQV
ncbi:MAG: DUF4440 domain-containing protein [Cellvibrio sp.]|jgi:hypothetical protein